MQTRGQRWAPKPTSHLNNAKERAHRHEVQCFDEELGKYEVTTLGDITSDGEVRPSMTHVVLLNAFSCGCGKPRQYHFPCSHYVAAARHRNFAFESRIPSEFSVESLVRTWSPRFEPFLDESQCLSSATTPLGTCLSSNKRKTLSLVHNMLYNRFTQTIK
jgi:hypothetical protein